MTKRVTKGMRGVLAMAAAVIMAAACGSKDIRNESVASVNGEDVKVYELREFMGSSGSLALGGDIPAERKKEALDRLVAGVLLAQDARKRGLDNTQEFRQAIGQNEDGARISALMRKEMDSKYKVEDKDVKEEAGKLRTADKNMSEKESTLRASRMIAEKTRRKIEEDLIAAARKDAGAAIRQETLQAIGSGAAVPDNAVLATVGTETISYGDVKRKLPSVMAGPRGNQDLAKNPMAIGQFLEREVIGRSLVSYAKKQGIEGSTWHAAARRELEKSLLIRALLENEVLKGVTVGDKDIEAAYKEHAQMFVRDGKKIPLTEVREQLRGFLLDAKRKKAAESYIDGLKQKAKITINEAVLPKV